jgi:hypothetical protein
VLRKIRDSSPPPHTLIRVFSDSQAALQRINRLIPTPGQYPTRKIWQYCDTLHQHKCKVQLEWIPGHSGIPGNEAADSLAKEAAETRPPKTPPTYLTYLKRQVRAKLLEEWQNIFNSQPHGRQYMGTPTLTLSPELRHTNRTVTSQIIYLRTGHGYLKDYYNRFKINLPNYTCGCGSITQTPAHLLLTCPQFARDRPNFISSQIGLPTIYDVLHEKPNMKYLTTFLEETGVATRHWFRNISLARAESEELATWANYEIGLGELNRDQSELEGSQDTHAGLTLTPGSTSSTPSRAPESPSPSSRD